MVRQLPFLILLKKDMTSLVILPHSLDFPLLIGCLFYRCSKKSITIFWNTLSKNLLILAPMKGSLVKRGL